MCPKNPGYNPFPSYCGDGIGTIKPTIFREGSGFLGKDMFLLFLLARGFSECSSSGDRLDASAAAVGCRSNSQLQR